MTRVALLNTSSGSAFSPVGVPRAFRQPQTQTTNSNEVEHPVVLIKTTEGQLTLGSSEGSCPVTSKLFPMSEGSKKSSYQKDSLIISRCHSPPSSTSGNSSTTILRSLDSLIDMDGTEASDCISSSSDANDINVTF